MLRLLDIGPTADHIASLATKKQGLHGATPAPLVILMLLHRKTARTRRASAQRQIIPILMSFPTSISLFRNRRWKAHLAWLAGALGMAALIWVLGTTYQARKLQHQHQAERELQTIGRLQAQALEGWRETRFSDADALTDDALLSRAVVRWSKSGTGATGSNEARRAQGLVHDRLRILQERSRYTAVAYVDLTGKVLLSGDSMGGTLPAPEQAALARAVENAMPQAVEPRQDPFFAFPFFSLIAPIFDGTQAVGAVWLVMDVRTTLYPLLSPWPTPSKTGESVLVAAQGKDALLLTPRRDVQAPGAGTVVSASQSRRAVVQAASGARGIIFGEDENHVAVLAVVNAVPDSPWYLVSQVQVSEAFGGAARRELLVLSLPISFAALLAGVILGGWQWRARRRESMLKERLAENMQWLESAQQAASIGYFVYDVAREQFRLSAMASTLLGLPADHPLPRARWLARVHEADRQHALDAIEAAVNAAEPLRIKYRLQSSLRGASHDRWLDMWGHHDAQEGVRRMTGTMQDITEREQAEATLTRYRDALETMVRQDALTSVANRRALTEAVTREWQRAARAATPISLLMIDVDFFKSYNDQYGHLAGDDCLRQVARALSAAATRSSDLVARYGGEEFAVLLPGTPAADAWGLAERARLAVQELRIEHKASGVASVVTVSIGVATLTPGNGTGLFAEASQLEPRAQTHKLSSTHAGLQRDSQRLFHAADQALYAAKDGGRNGVVAHAGADEKDRKALQGN